MKGARRIVLVGFMAAGKTSVAHALARLLGCEALDLDEVIAESEGRTIRELIEERGEDSFRGAESFTLRAVLGRSGARVLALGGGAWTVESNRALIEEHGCLTVWLDAPFELCWKRIQGEGATRPLAPDRAAAHVLYRERRPLYALASLRLPVAEGSSAEETAAELLKTARGLRLLKD